MSTMGLAEARSARIRYAMARYVQHENYRKENESKSAAMIVFSCALGLGVLAPFVAIASYWYGFLSGVIGLFYAVSSLAFLAGAEHCSEETLAECFAEVDLESPTLAEAIREHGASGIHEQWSGETI